jgi:hypothetical protein
MSKLKRHQLDFIRQAGDSMTDKQIARRLNVRVTDVRRARGRLARTLLDDGPASPSQLPVPRPSRGGRVLGGLGLAGLCALAMYYTMMPIFDGDFGWHAALGRYIVENRTVPTTEPFSHTTRGGPMVAHEWLAQAVHHLIIQRVGVLGLRWVNAALVAGMLIWLYRLLRHQRVTPALALCGVCLYFILAHDRFQHRPYLFHMAVFLVMYGYLFVHKPALTAARLAGIFLLTVFWVNAHSAAVLFSAIVVLYVTVESLQQKLARRRPQPSDLGQGNLRRLVLLSVAAVAALVITPNRFHLFPYLIESKRFNAIRSDEWMTVLRYWDDPSLQYSVFAFMLVAFTTIVIVGVTFRRRPWADSLVVLLLTLLPLSGLRFIAVAFVPLLFIFPAVNRWTFARAQADFARVHSAIRWLPPTVTMLLLAVTVYPTCWPKITSYPQRLTANWNFHQPTFPAAALDFLDEVNLEGRLFNPKKWGGYVLFRTYMKYPVFMDGRWITFGPKIFDDCSTIRWKRKGAAALLDEYDIDILLIHRDYVTADPRDRAKWIPVFENFNSGVYLRNHDRNAENLRKCAMFYLSRGIPFDMKRGFDERLAYLAKREWAESVSISRNHISMGRRMISRGW